MGEIIHMTMADGASVSVYRARAVGKRRGGLLLVQEIFGLNSHIRAQCDRFAAEGYDVLAPALYDREEPGFESDYQGQSLERAFALYQSHPLEQSMADLKTCFDALKASGDPVFMTGYCYGGLLTWLGACRFDGLAAASAYYAGGIDRFVNETPKCPIILHFGDRDEHIPAAAVDALRQAHPELPVYLYAAGHGFNCEQRGDFDAVAARSAWERTLDLFRAHEGGQPS